MGDYAPKVFGWIALAVMIAGCQTPVPPNPSSTSSESAAPSVQKTGGQLTFCGLTAQVQISQPPAGLPENFREFYGAFLGSTQSAYGGGCSAFVFTNVSNDGTVDFLAYQGRAHTIVFVEPRHGKISGNVLTYVGSTGYPTTITLVDANHIRFFVHTPRGYESSGDLERVDGGEKTQAQ